MNDRRLRIERGTHLGYRFQLFIFDGYNFGRVLGNSAAASDDGGDRFALPADTIDCERMLRRRFETLQMREHADPRRDDRREFCASYDRDDPADLPRLRDIDAEDLRMRMRRAQEHDMHHA